MLLIKHENNWSDEMDIYGFVVWPEEDWQGFLEDYQKVFAKCVPLEWYVGTNEYIIFEDYDQFLNSFEVVALSDDEAKVITTLFGHFYGFFPPEDPLDYFMDDMYE